ncbi:MAG: hypothetical protein QOD76_616 [Solirubrobacteraceae bacterium]|jgi:hypothetical protein|nr:hypothetical protein [Solirubrobacteraceae bacterium]
MPHGNQVPPDDSDAGRRAYERRYLRALEGSVSSRMRSQALKRRPGKATIASAQAATAVRRHRSPTG